MIDAISKEDGWTVNIQSYRGDNVASSPNGVNQREEVPGTPLSSDAESDKADKVTLSQEARKSSGEPLDEAEKKELDDLKMRDKEVRRHEQAHQAAAGRYAQGGASFKYQVGPNGNRYAVGGEVQIDVGKGRTPEETIQKAKVIRQAALAPAEPSAQDRRVAQKAAAMERSAQKEIAEKKLEEQVEAPNVETETEAVSDDTRMPPTASPTRATGQTEKNAFGAPISSPTDNPKSTSNAVQANQNLMRTINLNLKPSAQTAERTYSDILPHPSEAISPHQSSVEVLSIAI